MVLAFVIWAKAPRPAQRGAAHHSGEVSAASVVMAQLQASAYVKYAICPWPGSRVDGSDFRSIGVSAGVHGATDPAYGDRSSGT